MPKTRASLVPGISLSESCAQVALAAQSGCTWDGETWGDVVKWAQSSGETEINFGMNEEGRVGAAMICREFHGDCPPCPPAAWWYGVLVPLGAGGTGKLLHDVCPGMGSFLRLVHGQLCNGWWHRGRSGKYPSLSSSAHPGLLSCVHLGAATLVPPASVLSPSPGGGQLWKLNKLLP